MSDTATKRFPDGNAQDRRRSAPAVFGQQSSPPTERSASMPRREVADFTFDYSLVADAAGSRVAQALSLWNFTRVMQFNESEMGSGFGVQPSVPLPTLEWPPHESADRTSALLNTLALEQNAIGFDPTAGAILGRIFDHGHATCQDLADWLESPEEWIAFSRLQRARLLYDAGTEVTVSPAGRRLIRRLLREGDGE